MKRDFEKLSENILQFTSSGNGPVNALVQQEVAIGLGITQNAVTQIDEGVNLEVLFFEEGSPYSMYGQTIVSGKDKEVYTNLTIERGSTNKSFALEYNNDSLNIDNDINQRMLHTILFEFDKRCNPDTLNGVLNGCDTVISTVGLTGASTKFSCYDIDFQGNLNMHYKYLYWFF